MNLNTVLSDSELILNSYTGRGKVDAIYEYISIKIMSVLRSCQLGE